MTPQDSSSHVPSDSWLRAGFDLLISTLFLCVIGCLFVSFAVLLGKNELIILAYVLLISASVRSLLSIERRKKLEKVAIIGEGLKVFNRLEAHYIQHPPRSILYYVFFPVTGILSFFLSKDRGRQELKAYWGLLQWILVLLFIGGFSSYYRFYKHFTWSHSITWLYTELLAIYFLCNFFAVPLSTTSIRLSIRQKRFRLFVMTFVSVSVLSGFLYVFMYSSQYKNLIPIHLMLDQRLAELKKRVHQKPTIVPLHKRLLQKEEDRPYFERIRRTTELFLKQQAPRILAFNQQYLFAPDRSKRATFFKQINAAYQERLAPIATLEEHKQMVLTFTQEPRQFWGLFSVPFRESIFYIFHYKNKTLKLYQRLRDLPQATRKGLLDRWRHKQFVFSRSKRMSRVVVDFMRETFRSVAEKMDSMRPSKKSASNTLADHAHRAKERKKDALSTPSPSPASPPVPPPVVPRMRNRKSSPIQNKVPRSSGGKGNVSKRRRAKANIAQGKKRRRSRVHKKNRRFSPSKSARRSPKAPKKKGYGGQKRSARTPHGTGRIIGKNKRKRRRGIRIKRFISWQEELRALQKGVDSTDRVVQQLLDTLRHDLGLPSIGHKKPAVEQLVHIWPPLWEFPQIAEPLDHIRRYNKQRKNALKYIHIPDTTSKTLGATHSWKEKKRVLHSHIALLEKQLKRNPHSILVSQQLVRLRYKLATLRTPPYSSRRRYLSSQQTRKLHRLRIQLLGSRAIFKKMLHVVRVEWQRRKKDQQKFILHSQVLRHFDYPRALGARLLYDHLGATPALVQTWWTRFYEALLSFVMLLFQLTMPFHILAILYCQLRLSDEGLGLQQLSKIRDLVAGEE